jgi:hypothetical protein
MTALIGLFAITAILALLGGAAQAWGADSREGERGDIVGGQAGQI